MADFHTLLARVADGERLDADAARAAFEAIMDGAVPATQMAAFLMGLRVRGETVEEIAAAAGVLRARALPVAAPEDAIDTCGTGGDAKGTFNISTAAAFVIAGAGVPVAKHGNRSVSSKSGSADVLAALGVRLGCAPDVVSRAIAEAGIGFIFAPAHHAAMRHVAPVRKEVGLRTIFNLLGPLANPARTKRQVIGVFSEAWVEPLAHVLAALGSERVWVVHGSDGLDELTTTGPSHVAELAHGRVRRFTVTPEDAGIPRAKPESLIGGDAATNAAAIMALLNGAPGAFRDIVLLNAAAALVVADKAPDLRAGAAIAAESIDSGRARNSLARLIAITSG